jgi:hypothetical protein
MFWFQGFFYRNYILSIDIQIILNYIIFSIEADSDFGSRADAPMLLYTASQRSRLRLLCG